MAQIAAPDAPLVRWRFVWPVVDITTPGVVLLSDAKADVEQVAARHHVQIVKPGRPYLTTADGVAGLGGARYVVIMDCMVVRLRDRDADSFDAPRPRSAAA